MFGYTPNLWGVIAATVASVILGALWYSPLLFNKDWSKYSGIDMNAVDKKTTQKGYLIMAVSSLVTAYVLACFVINFTPVTVSDALVTAWWLWIGFVATTMSVNVAFGGHKWQRFIIDAGYQLASLLLMAALLYRWG